MGFTAKFDDLCLAGSWFAPSIYPQIAMKRLTNFYRGGGVFGLLARIQLQLDWLLAIALE